MANDFRTLYLEAHITIEPVFDERLESASIIARQFGFKMAELLMKKREADTEIRSSKDSFMTGHSMELADIMPRVKDCIAALKQQGFVVHRYKIEDTIIDSRHQDTFEILK